MTAASSAATDELARILEVAVGAARAAGAAIKDGAGRTAVEKSKASDIDLVTEVHAAQPLHRWLRRTHACS